MTRRSFVSTIALAVLASSPALAKSRRWKFRIKTKSGGVIGTTIEAKNLEAAKVILFKQYPDCMILDAEEG